MVVQGNVGGLMQWAALIVSTTMLLSACALTGETTAPSDSGSHRECNQDRLGEILERVIRGFDQGDVALVEGILTNESRFRWVSVDAGGQHRLADEISAVKAVVRGVADADLGLRLLSHRVTDTDEALLHFSFRVQVGESMTAVGKGALACPGGGLTVLSLGEERRTSSPGRS